MDRRTFIAAMGLSGAIAAINPLSMLGGSETSYPWFNPDYQYGGFLVLYDPLTDEDLRDAAMLLEEQVKCCIPPEYRGHIRYTYTILADGPNLYGAPVWWAAWKYDKSIEWRDAVFWEHPDNAFDIIESAAEAKAQKGQSWKTMHASIFIED